MIFAYFLKELEAITDAKVKAVVKKLLILYGLDKIIQYTPRFYETSTITPENISLIYQKKEKLLEELRPESLNLVEAFGFNDSLLMSAIAADNGKPYENLIEWA